MSDGGRTQRKDDIDMAKRKVSLRIDEEIYNELTNEAQANGTTLSDTISKRLDGASVVHVSDDKVDSLRGELIKISAFLGQRYSEIAKRGGNVNQIAKQVNKLNGAMNDKTLDVLSKNMGVFATWQREERNEIAEIKKRVDELWQLLK